LKRNFFHEKQKGIKIYEKKVQTQKREFKKLVERIKRFNSVHKGLSLLKEKR
jgi:hypothetical protein